MTTSEDVAIITASADSLAARLATPRVCPTCEQELPLSAFGINRARTSGHQRLCRSCHNEALRKVRSTPQGKAANIRAWRESTARALVRAGRLDDAARILAPLAH